MTPDLDLGDTRLIIKTAEKRGLTRQQCAYLLATAYHETAHTVKPVKETVMPYHKDRNPSDAEVKRRLERAFASGKLKGVKTPYWRDGFFGRGYVQLTWEANYLKAGKAIGVDLITAPEDAMEPNNAAAILVEGSAQGWFTGKKLSDYINGEKCDYVNARRIINGKDKADLIAGYARAYDVALRETYGVDPIEQARSGLIAFIQSLLSLLKGLKQ